MSFAGVHPAEWIFPQIGLIHTAHNTMMDVWGASSAKLATPGSKLDKARDAEQKLAETASREAAEAQERRRLAEQNRIAALPRNVEARANRTAASLGESGRRPTASQYLSGV